MLFKVCVRYYEKKGHTDTHKHTKEWAQKQTDFLLFVCSTFTIYQHGSPLVCHAPIQHDQIVPKTSLTPQAIFLRSSYSFVQPPKNTLKENKHKPSTGEWEKITACFDWALQIYELSILLLLPLPSPLYLRQFLNMVFISPTNSSLVQYWPPFNFFSMLEMSMGAWNTTKRTFTYSKHNRVYKVA